MQGINSLTMQCAYSTPCGWCTKWDKKCDKKIGCGTTNSKPQRGLRVKANMYDDAMNPCINCVEHYKVFNLCAECGGAPNYKHFKTKEE